MTKKYEEKLEAQNEQLKEALAEREKQLDTKEKQLAVQKTIFHWIDINDETPMKFFKGGKAGTVFNLFVVLGIDLRDDYPLVRNISYHSAIGWCDIDKDGDVKKSPWADDVTHWATTPLPPRVAECM